MVEKIQNIMKKQLSKKEKTILSISIAVWGVILLGSGLVLNAQDRTITKTVYSLNVSQKRVAQQRTNEIKLKEIEIEVNTPLSTDVKEYLEDIENLDESIFDYLRLDTSTVKISEPGEYTYTITYRKKKYNGTVKVKEKELPNVVLQLKEVRLKVGEAVSGELTTYISTPLTEEMKAPGIIQLDISKIKNNEPGEYTYTVVYNKATYIGKVIVENPKPVPVITPGTSCGDGAKMENNKCVCTDSSKTYDENEKKCK